MNKETSKKPLEFEEVIPETSKTAVVADRPEETPRVLLSNTDAYIHDRMKAQPKTLEEIRVDNLGKPKDPSKHRLSLPEELKDYGKKFAFRWLDKNKQSLDYSCDVRGWKILSRNYFPNLPKHLFTVNGSIERGSVILAFIPVELAEEIRKEPGEKSNNIIQGMFEKHSDDPRYYTPQSGTSEDREVKRI